MNGNSEQIQSSTLSDDRQRRRRDRLGRTQRAADPHRVEHGGRNRRDLLDECRARKRVTASRLRARRDREDPGGPDCDHHRDDDPEPAARPAGAARARSMLRCCLNG